MFEVGFSEIGLVGLVALIVIGPEKLPQVARIIGFWLGKTRSTVARLKAEADTQFQLEEMRQLLAQQTNNKAVEDLISDSESALEAAQHSAQSFIEAEINAPD